MPEENLPISAVAWHVDYEREVAALAWQYFQEEGCPEGRAIDHWLRAEREILRRLAPGANSAGDSTAAN